MNPELINEPEKFAEALLELLPYKANHQQVQVAYALARFCASPAENSVFILNGYAGTGKTSLTGALVRMLETAGVKCMLLAPTGRAAKVFSANSQGHPAWTIHRKIYKHNFGGGGEDGMRPVTRDNIYSNMLFIVDEASMIGDDGPEGGLLEDLVTYVYSGDNCRMILVGDTAQLPPVGSNTSPAMNVDKLHAYGLRVSHATMTETARQASDSGILLNATRLRKAMTACANSAKARKDGVEIRPDTIIPKLKVAGLPDVEIINDSEELAEKVDRCYREDGLGQTIIITRSNRKALEFNQGVRQVVLYHEESVMAGDMLIVAKNHYFVGAKPKGIDFIANGDILRVEKVYGFETKYGVRFADVALSFGDDNPFDIKIIVDSLYSDTAFISGEQYRQFYYNVLYDPDVFAADTPGNVRLRTLATNPYWNALYVKFAYAVTCHKAQGGQWQNVFVDLSYIPADALGMELYRWLYTAVTRARRTLYLISPPKELLLG